MGRIAGVAAAQTRLLAELPAADPDRSITDLLLEVGRWLPRRTDAWPWSRPTR